MQAFKVTFFMLRGARRGREGERGEGEWRRREGKGKGRGRKWRGKPFFIHYTEGGGANNYPLKGGKTSNWEGIFLLLHSSPNS